MPLAFSKGMLYNINRTVPVTVDYESLTEINVWIRKDSPMKIIKRNGSEEMFNVDKIINAVRKANNSSDTPFLTEEQIYDIADYVVEKLKKF